MLLAPEAREFCRFRGARRSRAGGGQVAGWSPYEEILGVIVEPSVSEWKERFRARYLDFTPVLHLLAAGDPRLGPSGGDEVGRLLGG